MLSIHLATKKTNHVGNSSITDYSRTKLEITFSVNFLWCAQSIQALSRTGCALRVQCATFCIFFVVSGKNNNSLKCLYSEHEKMTESGADKTMVNTVTMVKVNVRFMSRISHCWKELVDSIPRRVFRSIFSWCFSLPEFCFSILISRFGKSLFFSPQQKLARLECELQV